MTEKRPNARTERNTKRRIEFIYGHLLAPISVFVNFLFVYSNYFFVGVYRNWNDMVIFLLICNLWATNWLMANFFRKYFSTNTMKIHCIQFPSIFWVIFFMKNYDVRVEIVSELFHKKGQTDGSL